jgi:hypothetical protein
MEGYPQVDLLLDSPLTPRNHCRKLNTPLRVTHGNRVTGIKATTERSLAKKRCLMKFPLQYSPTVLKILRQPHTKFGNLGRRKWKFITLAMEVQKPRKSVRISRPSLPIDGDECKRI